MIKLHLSALEQHKRALFENLLYPFHRASRDGTLTRREFYTEESLARNGNKDPEYAYECDIYVKYTNNSGVKYVLVKDMIDKLPIRVKETEKMYDKKTGDVVYLPTEWNTFRIIPEKKYELRDIIQPFIFDHSNPKLYEMYVVTAFACLIGRVPLWVSGYRAFGKSSVFQTMDFVFNKVPVVESPNTVPAFYRHIPDTGIMVLDEMTRKDTDSAYNIHYILNLAGNTANTNVQVQTGGSAAYGTNVPKDVWNCSFVCLMNLYEDYSSKDKFAEYMFHNNVSLDRRYTKIRIDSGELDLKQFAEWAPYSVAEKAILINMAKSIEWYKPHYNHTTKEFECGLDVELDHKVYALLRETYDGRYKNTHEVGITWILKTFCVYNNNVYKDALLMTDMFMECMKAYKTALIDNDGMTFEVKRG